jgi:SNF2 family DNA or RNA helicase
MYNVLFNIVIGSESEDVKRKFKTLKYILQAFMLRRTKSLLVESGALALPSLTETTVYVRKNPFYDYIFIYLHHQQLFIEYLF